MDTVGGLLDASQLESDSEIGSPVVQTPLGYEALC